MSLVSELKRRNVFRVAAAYVVTAWLILQVVELIFPVYGFSDAAIRFVISALAVGLIPVIILAWAFELTPEGFRKEQGADQPQPVAPQAWGVHGMWIGVDPDGAPIMLKDISIHHIYKLDWLQ